MVKDCKNIIEKYGKQFSKDISNIHVHSQDFLNFDISNYDILFPNTTIDNNLRKLLINKISEEAKQGCIVISSINPFKSDKLKLIRRFSSNFSWGTSHINASIKI